MAGPSSRNGTSRGGRNGNQSGSRGNGATGGGGNRNNKSMQGRGGQADVAGRNTSNGDSADSRQSDASRRARNAFAANRTMDATTSSMGMLNGDEASDAARRDFDHARRSLTEDDRASIAENVTKHSNSTSDKVFGALGLVSTALSPAGPAVTQLAKSAYNADTYADVMDHLGAPMSTADKVNKTAQGFVPGFIGSQLAPVGAQLGYGVGGLVGANLGARTVKEGVKLGLESAMTDKSMSTPSGTPDRSNNGQTNQAVAANPATSANSVANAKQAFGYAKIDTDRYSSGLANVKV